MVAVTNYEKDRWYTQSSKYDIPMSGTVPVTKKDGKYSMRVSKLVSCALNENELIKKGILSVPNGFSENDLRLEFDTPRYDDDEFYGHFYVRVTGWVEMDDKQIESYLKQQDALRVHEKTQKATKKLRERAEYERLKKKFETKQES